ncbi:polyphosphate:AMP phosphotransferase [Pigmentiphaga soli]|uniref:Polyphosphate:AMP phosphotransferase n=1 Tax=Pigmentiphaga soli TaxID=1007095 RepID=A0ABP8GM00_9BURK
MFQEAELDPRIDDDAYRRSEAPLRIELLNRQYRLLDRRDRAVLLVVAGVDGAGKGSTVNLLNEWLDPRHVRTLAFGKPAPEEAQRPPMWRYWKALPAAGHIGIVFGSWYQPLMEEAARKKPDPERMAALAAAIVRFEAMLVAERVQVVKLFYHLSREAQAARIDAQLADPAQAWRVSKEDLKVRRKFARLRTAALTVVEATQTAHAPWQVIPAADANLRALRTGEALRDALRHRLPAAPHSVPAVVEAKSSPARRRAQVPAAGDYDEELHMLQARLGMASRSRHFKRRTLVLAFEGLDAAGKGGAIRRVTRAFDARQYEVVPISAPTQEELAHPYLWRFWQRLPGHGRIVVFDRSWYGRVLVERVQKLLPPAAWHRAYDEINDFEAQLADHGAVIVKFWLSISKDEQLRRFRERRDTPYKNFKLTPDDWRNRRKWNDYQAASQDMLARTDTLHAPWRVVDTDDKRAARLAVLREIVRALELQL